jgi:RNA-binding protein YlmH
MERTRERNKPVYLCFIDYEKAFDSVEHSKMWNSMRNAGITVHLIGLIRDLDTEQEAKVQVKQGATDWFPVQKGVRQGCILSPGVYTASTS